MPQCCAFSCKKRGVHRFPTNQKYLRLWIRAIHRKNWKPSSTSRLCGDHFRSSDYNEESKYTGLKLERKSLKKSAVPSIFSFVKPADEAQSSRSLRYDSRNYRKTLDFNNDNIMNIPDMAEEVQIKSSNVEECNKDHHLPNTAHKSTQINIEFTYGSIVRFKNDNEAIQFYTGFESFKKFNLVYLTLQPMVSKIKYYSHTVLNVSHEDQFFLTLMKLRQNKTVYELSKLFNISTSTASNIFITWVNFIYQVWSKLNIWPERKLVNFYMPETFNNYDKTVRVILDGTEISVQKPEHTIAQQMSWSNYKHSNTLKVLVGATPGGLISYCSPAYGGSTSDRQTIERRSLFNKCEEGDTILADRGFNVQDMFISKNIKVNTPSFLKGRNQLPGLTIRRDRELASKRVHIERLIGLAKTYKILKADLDHSYIPLASKIFFICAMCCNFREGIVNKNDLK